MLKLTRRAAFAAVFAFAGAAVAPVLAMDITSEIEAENAIRDSRRAPARIAGIRRVPSVGVINLNVPSGPFEIDRNYMDAGDFRALARAYATGVSRMRRALRANPATRAALADHGVDLGDVIGVRFSSNGSLRLFVFR